MYPSGNYPHESEPVHELLTVSATRLAELVRDREVSAREVVDAHIARIERVNPVINAVVAERFDAARAEADEADLRVRAGDSLPPLHGVPCTIKECFAFPGMPHTSGLLSRRGRTAEAPATAVTRLREAGAIPLGVTNLSELCMWMESDNRVYGRCNNPYDPTRIVGGSSGGEGAIVGAGGSPFGLGADIGGSIRMPAFFNGVFGHKPTGGLVPSTGHFPTSENEALRYLTTGPLARRAEDLMPLLRILAGGDGRDAGCIDLELGDPDTVDVTRLRVWDVEDDGGRTSVSDDLRGAQRRVAAHLASLGCRVERTRIEELSLALEIWSSMLAEASDTTFAELLFEGQPIPAWRELLKWAFRRSDYTLPSIGLALIEKAVARFPKRTAEMVAKGRALRKKLDALLDGPTIMLYPSYSEPAPKHGRPLLPPTRWVYAAAINVMELPATQVPLGLSREGIPLGVQVVGGHGNDHLTIAVARELERTFGGWLFPHALG